jgi:hypothetical protein
MKSTTNTLIRNITIVKFRFSGIGLIVCQNCSNVSAYIAVSIFRANVWRLGELDQFLGLTAGVMGRGCAAMEFEGAIIWLRRKFVEEGVNTHFAQFAFIFTDEVVVVLDYISVFPCSARMVSVDVLKTWVQFY